MSQVERTGDMNKASTLIVCRQEDGDIIVRIIDSKFGKVDIAEVEFCLPVTGGQSPATHESLRKLMEAIQEDNDSERDAFTPKAMQGFGSEPE